MNVNEAYVKYLKILMIVLCPLFSTSCGFRPVYKAVELNKLDGSLTKINILPLESINGANYYNHLKTILPHNNNTFKYILETNLSYSKGYNIIQRNSDIFRKVIVIRVLYKIIEPKTNKLVTSGKFSRPSSFSIDHSPYNNHIKEQEVSRSLAFLAAEEVKNRIVLFFENNKV